jgi:hypothetical protein
MLCARGLKLSGMRSSHLERRGSLIALRSRVPAATTPEDPIMGGERAVRLTSKDLDAML